MCIYNTQRMNLPSKRAMKNLIIFLIIICSFPLFAQDWVPFPYNQKTWFEFSNEEHQSVSIYYADLLISEADTNHYYFRRNYLEERLDLVLDEQKDACLNFFENNTADFISIKHPFSEANGQYTFKGKTVFDTQLQPGEGIYIYPAGSSHFEQIYIECVEQKWGEILEGLSDSLKVFNIQAFSNGTAIESDFDEYEYILSKQYGFVKFIPFIELLRHPKTTATLSGIGISDGRIIGERYNNSYFFPYQIGDVLTYVDVYNPRWFPNHYREYYRDSITSVSRNQDLLKYTVEGYKVYLGYYEQDTVEYMEERAINISERNPFFEESIYGLHLAYEPYYAEWRSLDQSNLAFSFIDLSSSSNFNYGFDQGIVSRYCDGYSTYDYKDEWKIYNNELGQLSYYSITIGKGRYWELITYQRGDKQYTPCATIDSVYLVNDNAVDLQNDYYHNSEIVNFTGPGVNGKQFIPSLVPDSLLNIPIEITCRVLSWSLTQQTIVRKEEPCLPPQPGVFECNE